MFSVRTVQTSRPSKNIGRNQHNSYIGKQVCPTYDTMADITKPNITPPVVEVIRRVFSKRTALVWRLEWVDSRWSKVPYRCDDPRRRADGTKPTLWTIDQAIQVYESFNDMVKGRMDGVGIPICDGLVMHDEDHKYNPATGFVEQGAHGRITMLDSFTELSPSGEGIHVFAYGQLPPGRRRGSWEMYASGRYSTVTGASVPGFNQQTIQQRPHELEALALMLTEEDPRGKEAITTSDTRFVLPDQIPASSRHDTLWRHMRSMQARDATFEEALDACLEVNFMRCIPPLAEDTVREYITRVWHVADRPGFTRPPKSGLPDDGWS